MERTRTHAYHRILYHLVWATKNREPLITPRVEKWLFHFFRRKSEVLGGLVLELNGVEDHVHLLVQLAPKHQPSKFVKDLKGSSSFFLSRQADFNVAFKWQPGYGIFSVGTKEAPFVQNYIRRQKEHHQTGSTIPVWETWVATE